MTLTLIAAPAERVVTPAEAKAWCRVEDDAEDSVIATMLDDAIRQVEDHVGRGLGVSTWRLTLDTFPSCGTIELPRVPAVAVTSVTYLDEDGAEQTFDAGDYALDLVGNPARVMLDAEAAWPTLFDGPNAAVVNFTAGYTAQTLPAPLKTAVLMLVAQAFDDRAPGRMPEGVMTRLSPYRRILI